MHPLDNIIKGADCIIAQNEESRASEDELLKLWTPQMREFVQQHANDDVSDLLLSASKYKGIDMPFAARQIEARRRLRDKLPEWYANPDLVMGGRVPAEQCSSEDTARFKRGIISGNSLCDLTGGMGVDFWYMSEGMQRAIYTERSAMLCEAARHNFSALATDGVERVVRCGDGRELPLPDVDVIYLDPARRAVDGSRVYAIEDCEPNVVDWQDALREHARMVLVKLSPMIDITDMIKKLRCVTDVYIVGVRNECKEVLVKMNGTSVPTAEDAPDVMMHCVDFMPSGIVAHEYSMSCQPQPTVASAGVLRFLYEPDVTLMKAQAFGSLCQRYDVSQLDYDTHLMTSDSFVADFPGRRFEVKECVPCTSRALKQLRRSIPKANVAARNFILTADQLKKRASIKDGGDVYLFGAKVKDQGDMLIQCGKA